MNWYLEVIKKYAVFSGRARRKEFWMFYLFNFIIAVVLGIICSILHLSQGTTYVISSIYSLFILLPGLGVSVRRLHDIGKSGLWLLISLVPIVGAIILLIYSIKEGTPGANAYGPNPKEENTVSA